MPGTPAAGLMERNADFVRALIGGAGPRPGGPAPAPLKLPAVTDASSSATLSSPSTSSARTASSNTLLSLGEAWSGALPPTPASSAATPPVEPPWFLAAGTPGTPGSLALATSYFSLPVSGHPPAGHGTPGTPGTPGSFATWANSSLPQPPSGLAHWGHSSLPQPAGAPNHPWPQAWPAQPLVRAAIAGAAAAPTPPASPAAQHPGAGAQGYFALAPQHILAPQPPARQVSRRIVPPPGTLLPAAPPFACPLCLTDPCPHRRAQTDPGPAPTTRGAADPALSNSLPLPAPGSTAAPAPNDAPRVSRSASAPSGPPAARSLSEPPAGRRRPPQKVSFSRRVVRHATYSKNDYDRTGIEVGAEGWDEEDWEGFAESKEGREAVREAQRAAEEAYAAQLEAARRVYGVQGAAGWEGGYDWSGEGRAV